MSPAWQILLALLAIATAAPLELDALRVRGFGAATLEEGGEPSTAWSEARFRQWSIERDGISRRIVEVRLGPDSPRTPSGFLANWRRSHGCTSVEVADFPPVGRPAPPQLTFEGVCKAGDRYVIRVLVVGDLAYELHVDGHFATRSRLHAEMRELVAQVELIGEPRER